MNQRIARGLLALFAAVAVAAYSAEKRTPPDRVPDVPYEPSTPEVVDEMLRLANVTSRDLVYDLGCGDGRIVIAAARNFHARAIGVDIDPKRIAEARANARKAGVTRRVNFLHEDLFEARISAATVVMLYLWPEVNLKLRPKLLRELKPGTRIVSHSHDMGDWEPEKELRIGGERLYFWTVPAKKPLSAAR